VGHLQLWFPTHRDEAAMDGAPGDCVGFERVSHREVHFQVRAGCGDFDFAAGPDTLGLTHWMLEGIQSSPQRNSAAVANETSFADRAPLFSR
jgi:hypothetical protein